jgi:hypothetical protein
VATEGSASSGRTSPEPIECLLDSTEDLLSITQPIDRGQLSLTIVVLEQGRCLHLEAQDPLGEDLGIVVGPLPSEHPTHEFVARHSQLEHPIDIHGTPLEKIVER